MLVFVIVAMIALAVLPMLWRRRQPVPVPLDPSKPYSVYCRDFDAEVRSDQLDVILGRNLTSSSAAHHDDIEAALSTWRIRHDFATLETAGRIRAAVDEVVLRDTVVCMLVDHSGSMRGQKMLLTVGAVTLLSDLLAGLKVTQEVLGFTTIRWTGGRSRRKWLREGRPPYPGRLNDILHIIYCNAGDAPRRRQFATMLRPDLLKENIDGEAIEWAASRLRSRAETHKHLIVVSDGAPVDDSTLVSNGGAYLENHLRAVIGDLSISKDIRISAIGIQYAVDRYYAGSVTIHAPDDLGEAMLTLIEQLLSAQSCHSQTQN